MDELISRQAAIDVIDAVFQVDPMKSEYAQGIACGAALAKTYVEQLPSAQPEIVRCVECKWFQCNMRPDGYLPQGVDEFECRHWCGSCDPTDFCSYAERREVTT